MSGTGRLNQSSLAFANSLFLMHEASFSGKIVLLSSLSPAADDCRVIARYRMRVLHVGGSPRTT